MPGLPSVTAADIVKVLEAAGFKFDRQKGSHMVFKKPSQPLVIVVPNHRKKNIGPGLLRKIIRNSGLTVEEFIALL